MSSDLASLLNLAPPAKPGPRRAWLFTSALRQERAVEGRLKEGETAGVSLELNPQEARFKTPRRVTKQNTQGGAIIWHFMDENEEANDLLELVVKLNTHNFDEREPDLAMKRLSAWTNLWLLTRERELTDSGRPNRRELIFETPAMPYPIVFQGYFENVPDPQLLDTQPHSMDVEFKFVVTASEPPIRDWAQHLVRSVLGA